MKILLALAAFTSLLVAAPTAQAQYEGVLGSPADYVAYSGVISDSARPDSKAKTATRSTTNINLAYTPTPALRQQTVATYVARIKATNPTAAATVADNLAPGKTEYSALYRELNQGTGLRENDVADIMAAYMIVGWTVVNNVQDGNAVTVPMARRVRAQTASVLAKNAKLRTPSAVAQLGEQFKLTAVMLQIGWMRAVKDGTDASFRQQVAAQFQKQFHLNLSQLKLTEQGLAKK